MANCIGLNNNYVFYMIFFIDTIVPTHEYSNHNLLVLINNIIVQFKL